MAIDVQRFPSRAAGDEALRTEVRCSRQRRIRRPSAATFRAFAARISVDVEVRRYWRWAMMATPLLFIAGVMFEPAQANQPAPTMVDWVLTGVFMIALISYIPAAIDVGKGLRKGLVLTIPATLLLLLGAVSCPVSGHHAWGAWVIGSFACAFAATGIHLGSLLATRGGPKPETK
jgi:hypothetical protein